MMEGSGTTLLHLIREAGRCLTNSDRKRSSLLRPIESALFTKVPGTQDFTPGLILGLALTQATKLTQNADEPWVNVLLGALEGAILYTQSSFVSPHLEQVSVGDFPVFEIDSDQAVYAALLLTWSESLNVG